MRKYNLWTDAGLHNCAKGTFIYFVYNNYEDTRSGELSEAVVVQICELYSEVVNFTPRVPETVAIPVQRVEWKSGNSANFIRHQIPLMISWAFTIHKAQGKTPDIFVINTGIRKKGCGMTLVALSRVRELKYLLLKPFSMERLVKVYKANSLPIIRSLIHNLNVKPISAKTTFQVIWHHINN